MTVKKTQSLIPTNASSEKVEAQGIIRGLKIPENWPAIMSDQENEQANLVLRAIASARKQLEARRKKVTDPLNKAKNEVMAMFKPLITQLDEARTDLITTIDTWEDFKEEQAEKERERERRKAEAQAKRAETLAEQKREDAQTREELEDINAEADARKEAALSVGEAKASMVNGVESQEGVSKRMEWDYKVEDIDAVPRKWLRSEVRRRKVLAYANSEELQSRFEHIGEGPSIPGLRFVQTRKRSVRSL